MGRRRKSEIEDLPSVTEASKADTPPKISFAHWFDKQLKNGAVRHYQDEALLVFFKKQGLKNTEMEDTYNRAFEKF